MERLSDNMQCLQSVNFLLSCLCHFSYCLFKAMYHMLFLYLDVKNVPQLKQLLFSFPFLSLPILSHPFFFFRSPVFYFLLKKEASLGTPVHRLKKYLMFNL